MVDFVIGEVPGVPVGAEFASFDDLRKVSTLTPRKAYGARRKRVPPRSLFRAGIQMTLTTAA